MKYTNFKLKLRAFFAVFAMVIFAVTASAQKVTVTGIVNDAVSGESILGANILEKGTGNGTITNLDGKFSISVSPNATLVVKYVGYKPQEILVAGQKNLVIKLEEDAVAINEVMVIGYGTVRKNDATGSVTAIKPDAMNKGLTTNAQDLIMGKIAGVNITTGGGTPGGGATIRIRGGSSLNASNDPLIVIDGLAMDNEGIKGVANPLSAINPNDIESFTVLKDASATAIYGSRASNGVIIITTKKGEKGSKPRVSYEGNVSVSSVKKTLSVLSADQFRSYVDSLYADKPNILSKLGSSNTDWQKQVYQTAISQDHNISVIGGLKNMPYRFSVGYTNQNGIVKTSNFERYSGAFNLSPTLFEDHLKINLNAKGMVVNNRFADGGVVGSATAMDPTQPVKSTDDIYVRNFGGYYQWYLTDSQTGITSGNSNAVKNPVATLNQKRDVSNAKDFIGSADFDYKVHFLPELKLHLNLGMEKATGIQTLYVDSLSASDTHHGRRGWEEIDKLNQSLSYYMQYAKEIGASKFDVMGGYEWQKFYREKYNEYEGLETDIVDTKTGHIGGYSYEGGITSKNVNFLVSFFGRINYSLKDKYLATFTLRRDGSSFFSAENRWGLFPAAALAWKINEEDFLKNNNYISDFKLRLGYGVTGQQNINQGDAPYMPVYSVSKSGALYPLGENGEYVTTYKPVRYNSNLRWEQTATYNAGIDISFFDSRIAGAVDYYHRVTTDLLNEVEIPGLANFSNRLMSNVGSLKNDGVEFSVNAKAITTKDLTWDIGYNVTYNKNKIIKLNRGTTESSAVETGGISSGTGNNIQAHAVGHAASSFYVYQQIYDSITGKPMAGKFVDRDENGVINVDDRYFYKKPTADVTMGLSSKIIYKNFDLGISLRASLGNYVYNDVAASHANISVSNVYSAEAFTNIQTSALETNFTGNNLGDYFKSDYYVQEASFIRCDNITFGYSIKNLFKIISSGRLYATVQNPFVITNYKGLDPEIYGGIDNNIYPRPIITMIGLSLNF